jgi:Uma2 family endonuclease
MAQAVHRVHYTRSEYIALERASNVKHEFLDGVIYAMAGGSPDHAAIAANGIAALGPALRGQAFHVYTSDLRVRVADTGLETYPDVTVVAAPLELDPADSHVVTNPVLLVEVTSPSTEEYDRAEKLEHYKRIPSVREVVLVGHVARRIEVVMRSSGDRWTTRSASSGGVVELTSVGVELVVDDVYAGTTVGAAD